MKRTGIGLYFAACVVAAASGARGAELPTRSAQPTPAPAKSCTVNGAPGIRVGGSEVCLRISGYLSGQVEAGTLAKGNTLVSH